MNGIGALRKETPESSLGLPPCEVIMRIWPSVNQEPGSHQTPNLLAP